MAILVDDSAETVLPIYVEAIDLIGFERLGPDPQGRRASELADRVVVKFVPGNSFWSTNETQGSAGDDPVATPARANGVEHGAVRIR